MSKLHVNTHDNTCTVAVNKKFPFRSCTTLVFNGSIVHQCIHVHVHTCTCTCPHPSPILSLYFFSRSMAASTASC